MMGSVIVLGSKEISDACRNASAAFSSKPRLKEAGLFNKKGAVARALTFYRTPAIRTEH